MLKETRRKLDMADRVQAFNQANPPTDPELAPVFEQLVARVTRANALIQEEAGGRSQARTTNRQRRQLRATLLNGHLRHLVRVGLAGARLEPALGRHFRAIRHNAPNRLFVSQAQALIATARERLELLGPLGVTEAMLDEASRLLDEFVTVSADALAGRRTHVGARAELEAVTAEIVELVNRIDGIHRLRFRGQPDKLAAWESAKDILGPFRRKNGGGAPGDPPSGGELGKAA